MKYIFNKEEKKCSHPIQKPQLFKPTVSLRRLFLLYYFLMARSLYYLFFFLKGYVPNCKNIGTM